ncbi:2-phospho-L-lactate guanylyltransferase [Leekyejoonella antrihumi]|uniref:2-phospho-L-lactate guanylyltransferase n=1 Tax=Leekyejoonella antrihumi TaxID=1660198 RepID=UPI0016485A4C|nr:2-phospho-L-lactate guanylyltransferase [Leekyejoonella antrihumi]
MNAAVTSTWHLVVPVKDHHQGKSRLHPPHGVQRSDLALAIAIDTLEVVLEVLPADHLVVVSSDSEIATHVGLRGARVLPDPGRGLNAAVVAGITATISHHPGVAGAILLGDLPALTATELYDGLHACAAAESSLVPDHEGTGTVLLAHHDVARLQPRFGTGSAARHARTATRLDLALPRLRTDVDDDVALAAASALGLGPATSRVLANRSSTGPDDLTGEMSLP